jgi:drug/metabolite transporter (DMT)-like permease
MTASRTLHRKTYVLLVLMVFFGAVGDVLLSKGMKQIGAVDDWSPAALFDVFLQTFTSGTIWLGIACLILFFVGYMLVLSWADFSYVLPATATSYALVPLLGFLMLGEFVSSLRWAGVAFICLGVLLVGTTSPSTTRAAEPPAGGAP